MIHRNASKIIGVHAVAMLGRQTVHGCSSFRQPEIQHEEQENPSERAPFFRVNLGDSWGTVSNDSCFQENIFSSKDLSSCHLDFVKICLKDLVVPRAQVRGSGDEMDVEVAVIVLFEFSWLKVGLDLQRSLRQICAVHAD